MLRTWTPAPPSMHDGERHMKLLNFLTLTFVLGMVAMEAQAATFYTYIVPTESLPCNSANCPANSTIALQGTITTDGVGTLAANDIVSWYLTVTLSGQQSITLTQNLGQFGTFGSPQILATSSDLTMTRNTSSDGFVFGGSIAAPASWFYGLAQAEMFSYNTDPNTQYTAQQMLATPSTFTAVAVSATQATPEPASVALCGGGLLGVGLLFRKRKKA